MPKRSIFFSNQMEERRGLAKEVTGYADQYIFEHGLLKIEAEIAAARAREGKSGCPHPDRYPKTGLCRFCLEPPATRAAADGRCPSCGYPPGSPGHLNACGDGAAVPPVSFNAGAP